MLFTSCFSGVGLCRAFLFVPSQKNHACWICLDVLLVSKCPTKKTWANGKIHVPVAMFAAPKRHPFCLFRISKAVSDSNYHSTHAETPRYSILWQDADSLDPSDTKARLAFQDVTGAPMKTWKRKMLPPEEEIVYLEINHFLWFCACWDVIGLDPKMLLSSFWRAKCMACFKNKLKHKNIRKNAIGSLNFVL